MTKSEKFKKEKLWLNDAYDYAMVRYEFSPRTIDSMIECARVEKPWDRDPGEYIDECYRLMRSEDE
jgi:hypothetical protein